jgi:hypothetical protein
VKIQHNDQFLNLLQLQTENTLQSVDTLPIVHTSTRKYPVRFQQWLSPTRTENNSQKRSHVSAGWNSSTMRTPCAVNNSMRSYTKLRNASPERYSHVELQHQRECSFKSIGFHQYTSPWRRVVFLFLRRLLVSNNKHPSILARAVHKQWSSWNLCSHKVKKVALTEFNTYCLFTNGRSTLSFLVKLSQVWVCNFRAFQVMFFAVCCGSKLISSGSST